MLVESLDMLYRVGFKMYLTRGEGKIDRETAHFRAVDLLNQYAKYLPKFGELFRYSDSVVEFDSDTLRYPSRIGFAAGINKDGLFLRHSKNFGAAFDTVGGVAVDEYNGAERPRIVADRNGLGLMNWMRLPTAGQEVVWSNIQRESETINRNRMKIFVNTVVTEKSIKADTVVNDFDEVNRFFLDKDIDVLEMNFGHLATKDYQAQVAGEKVFNEVVEKAAEYNSTEVGLPKILAVKLSMDAPIHQLRDRIRRAARLGIDYINIGNTTRQPEILNKLDLYYPDQGGGYCGPLALPYVLEKIEAVSEICREENRVMVISAGVDDWKSAVRAHVAGIDLIQSLHGFIMPKTGGPGFFYRINREVSRFCREMGLRNVSQLKGQRWALEYLDEPQDYDLDNWN